MILPLEKQVCSLESAKRLKKLGFKQESLFYWCKYKLVRGIYVEGFDEPKKGWRLQLGNKEGFRDCFSEVVSAYTVAELGEMLPAKYYTQKRGDHINDVMPWGTQSLVSGGDGSFEESEHSSYCGTWSETEAEARAKMLIFLAENNLIKPEGL